MRQDQPGGGTIIAGGLTFEINSDNISVTVIGGEDQTVTSLTIPETVEGTDYVYTVTAIKNSAFQGYTRLENVVLPKQLEEIGYGAFKGCVKLNNVEIPKSLKRITTTIVSNKGVFEDCTSLKEITFEKGTTSICSRLFYNCTSLEGIDIPETVTNIRSYAFSGCSNLKSIIIPEGTSIIEQEAFRNCISLTEVDTRNVTVIGKQAFAGCTKMERIVLSKQLEEVNDGVFYGCSKLNNVEIPKSLKSINIDSISPIGMFANCPSLKTVTFEEGITSIWNLFYNCTSLESIDIPETVTLIGKNAFNGCSNLKSIIIPEGTTTIGQNAFKNCTSLTEIDTRNVTVIGTQAFQGCTRMEIVVLSKQLEEIGEGAFYGCSKLNNVEIPKSLKSIGLSSMGIFGNCSSLKTVTFEEGTTSIWNLFYNCTSLESIDIPETVTLIGKNAFNGCSNLKSIIIPEGTTTIGQNAFRDCTSLTEVDTRNVTVIGMQAFQGCTKMETVILSKQLEEIDEGAFYGCSKLNNVEIPKSLKSIGLSSMGIFGNCPSLKTVTFEEGITSIWNLFYNCTSLESIDIPETVTLIGKNAFNGCSNLKSIIIPEGTTTIGQNAFRDCTSLTEVDTRNVTVIGMQAFQGCTKMETVVLSKQLEEIGEGAFYGCSKLNNVEIPKSLKSIGLSSMGIFGNCPSLKTVTFEEGTTSIWNLFYNCTSLESIDIPETVTLIGQNAFNGCTGLTTVRLPDSVTTIGSYAFANCKGLKEIYIMPGVTEIKNGCFQQTPYVVLKVSRDSYASAYAIENGLAFEWVENETEDSESRFTDSGVCQYFMSEQQDSAMGYLNLQVEYGFKPVYKKGVSNMELRIYIPENTTLIENTIMNNGALSTDYSMDGNLLVVPVSKTSGTVGFCIKAQEYDKLYSFAGIRFTINNKNVYEVIGALDMEPAALTLEMDKELDSDIFEVSGIALPDRTVTLYIDGVKAKSVKASRTGVYNTALTIEKVKKYKTYNVTAESTDGDGVKVTVKKSITYTPGIPALRNFTMRHNGQEYSLTDLKGLKPIVTFNSASGFAFEAEFENAEEIDTLYFVSTRGNIKKKMEAAWNPDTQSFWAEGYFDENDKGYVPGTITIEYIRKGKIRYVMDPIDLTGEEYLNSLPVQAEGAKVSIIKNTEDEMEAVIMLQDDAKTELSFSLKTGSIPEGLTEQNAVSMGYTRIPQEYLQEMAADQQLPGVRSVKEEMELFFREVLNEITGEIQAEVLDFKQNKRSEINYTTKALEAFGLYKEAAGYVSAIETWEGNRIDIREAERAIRNSTMSASEKASAMKHLSAAEMVNNRKIALKALSTLVAVSGLTSPMIGLTLGAISFLSDYELKLTMLDIKGLAAKKTGSAQISFRWAIDPSGYVYDAKTGKRIAGAKVTLYYKEEESGTPILWDAAEYLQLNPLISAEDGTYAWDVPEGLWQVKAEKEGYDTAYSDWLAVPPPQTEVGIAMRQSGVQESGPSSKPGSQEEDSRTQKVSSILITGISGKIAAGKKLSLSAVCLPENAGNKSVKWTSSNEKYAVVSADGVVTTKKAGAGKKVVITAAAADGSGVTASYRISIMKHAVKKIKLTAKSKTLKAGRKLKIKAEIRTSGKNVNKKLKWSSSNEQYATVSAKGVVQAKKAGRGKTVTITAASTDGTNKKAKIKIRIK